MFKSSNDRSSSNMNLTNWRQFSMVCPIIDHEFRHNIVKVIVDPLDDLAGCIRRLLTYLKILFQSTPSKFCFTFPTPCVLYPSDLRYCGVVASPRGRPYAWVPKTVACWTPATIQRPLKNFLSTLDWEFWRHDRSSQLYKQLKQL